MRNCNCCLRDLREILRCPEGKDIRAHAQMVMDDIQTGDELVRELRHLDIEAYTTSDEEDNYAGEVE